MLDYRVETFLAVYETMNYHAAAERLHITQPAVTQHIQYLERAYRCRLFAYDGRRLRRTAEGDALAHAARAMRYRDERLRERLQAKAPQRCAIGATKTVGEYVIGAQVARFVRMEDCALSVEVDNTAGILARLDRGALDFALVEGTFDRAAYDSRLYRADPFVGLCAIAHPFAGQRIPPSALWGETLLLREEGSGTRQILDGMLAAHSRSTVDFVRVACVSSFRLIGDLIAEGLGITFAYRAVGMGDARLAPFFVEGWDIVREFNYVYLPGSGAEELVERFDRCREPEPEGQ